MTTQLKTLSEIIENLQAIDFTGWLIACEALAENSADSNNIKLVVANIQNLSSISDWILRQAKGDLSDSPRLTRILIAKLLTHEKISNYLAGSVLNDRNAFPQPAHTEFEKLLKGLTSIANRQKYKEATIEVELANLIDKVLAVELDSEYAHEKLAKESENELLLQITGELTQNSEESTEELKKLEEQETKNREIEIQTHRLINKLKEQRHNYSQEITKEQQETCKEKQPASLSRQAIKKNLKENRTSALTQRLQAEETSRSLNSQTSNTAISEFSEDQVYTSETATTSPTTSHPSSMESSHKNTALASEKQNMSSAAFITSNLDNGHKNPKLISVPQKSDIAPIQLTKTEQWYLNENEKKTWLGKVVRLVANSFTTQAESKQKQIKTNKESVHLADAKSVTQQRNQSPTDKVKPAHLPLKRQSTATNEKKSGILLLPTNSGSSTNDLTTENAGQCTDNENESMSISL